MIHADRKTEIEIKGNLYTEIGPEAVLILGEIYDKVCEETSKKIAKEFIMIIAASAITESLSESEADANKEYIHEAIAGFMKEAAEAGS